jgi:antitoxin ParD1/3/4
MSSVQVTLPDAVKEFLDAEVAAKGYSSPGEYLAALLSALQKGQAWDNLEPLVLEGLASPAREMIAGDWQALRDRIDQIEATPALSDEEFEALLEELDAAVEAALGPNPPVLSDYAVSRAGIYQDHP